MEARNFSTLAFTEGLHYTDGGWFRNGDIAVEFPIDSKWKKVDTMVSPAYPSDDSQDKFGENFEIYTFTLTENTLCEGVQISGVAGGKGDFISINELVVG